MATPRWIGTTDDYGTNGNWSGGAVPGAGDDVHIENSSQAIGSSLNQSAVALNSFNRAQSMTGNIGTAAAYLQLGFGSGKRVRLGYQYGGTSTPTGPKREKLDFGSADVTVDCFATSSSSETGEDYKQPTRLKFGSASAVLNLYGGKVGVAADAAGETSTIGTINQIGGSTLVLGAGVTLTTLNKSGGDCIMQCGATTVRQTGVGNLEVAAAAAITNLYVQAGTGTHNGSGTVASWYAWGGTSILNGVVTNLLIDHGGIVDLTQSARSRAFPTTVMGFGTIKVNTAHLTGTVALDVSTTEGVWEIQAAIV